VPKEVKFEGLHYKTFYTLATLAINTLEACNEIHTLINGKRVPDQVLLIAHTEEFTHTIEREILDLMTHQLC